MDVPLTLHHSHFMLWISQMDMAFTNAVKWKEGAQQHKSGLTFFFCRMFAATADWSPSLLVCAFTCVFVSVCAPPDWPKVEGRSVSLYQRPLSAPAAALRWPPWDACVTAGELQPLQQLQPAAGAPALQQQSRIRQWRFRYAKRWALR